MKMKNINDCILAVTGGPTAPDGMLKYYKTHGAASNNLVDAEREFLLAKGSAPSHVDDMWVEYLTGLGLTGALADQLKQFWCGVAIPGIEYGWGIGEAGANLVGFEYATFGSLTPEDYRILTADIISNDMILRRKLAQGEIPNETDVAIVTIPGIDTSLTLPTYDYGNDKYEYRLVGSVPQEVLDYLEGEIGNTIPVFVYEGSPIYSCQLIYNGEPVVHNGEPVTFGYC